MRISKIGLILTLVFFSSSLSKTAGKDSVDLASIMNKTQKIFKGLKSVSVKFTTKSYWQAMDEWRSSKGKLWLDSGGKFHLFLPEMELVSNGKDYWQYSQENEQVLVDDFENIKGRQSPGDVLLQFLLCEPLSYVKMSEKEGEYYLVNLKPSQELNHYDSIQVRLKTNGHTPHSLYTLDNSENRVQYVLEEIDTKISFKDEDFTFVPPTEIEIIDMRE